SSLMISSLALAACSGAGSTMGPTDSGLGPAVLTVSPAAGALAVSPSQPVTITFSMPMMAGMESRVVLHEGSVAGVQVTGTATWSANRTVLTFMPAAPLKPGTTYVIHLSPELTGQSGEKVNLGSCVNIGGQQVTSSMMNLAPGASMMNGQWGAGMMGEGWRASDGSYGMYFTFRTS
ncbi:MAG: Ig-like domain-containing protein, partial [Gemmatimonadota bacterium]|nr:Ig-like domain-containing protein [Gemmatimonadota bacterium]